MIEYGKELIIDLHNCNSAQFTRTHIRKYFIKLCGLIDMERCKLVWWDDLHTPKGEEETEPHLIGTSAIQFIKTSNITIHALEQLHKVYLNIFSCKDFDDIVVSQFSEEWFDGEIVNRRVISRI